MKTFMILSGLEDVDSAFVDQVVIFPLNLLLGTRGRILQTGMTGMTMFGKQTDKGYLIKGIDEDIIAICELEQLKTDDECRRLSRDFKITRIINQ